MRIGFASIYPWRPHVEHLYFLASLAKAGGHEVAYLTCDADLPACYARELLKERPAALHCLLCRLGGVRSYANESVSSIGRFSGNGVAAHPSAIDWSRSSAGTLGRFESPEEFTSSEFDDIVRRLSPAVAKAYAGARKWIEHERLDAICAFNGRLDVTRAVFEAARDAGIRYVSMERTWFGDGLQLLPDEDCLGLKSVDAMVSAWADAPLSEDQALRAARLMASRFLRRNNTEWRAYNVSAAATPWPADGARRILLVPGSRNEVWAHADWATGWAGLTDAYDALIDHWRLNAADLVLRCHPNWSENIGSVSGARSERYFVDWAHRRGISVVPSAASVSTLGLMEQAEAVVVSGGTAGVDAGILGKRVIAIAPSMYQRGGFQETVYSSDDINRLGTTALAPERVRRQTLRFCYTMNYRVPQYVDHVRCVTTTRYAYLDGADPARLGELVRTGVLQPDDPERAHDSRGETDVLNRIQERRWGELLPEGTPNVRKLRPLHRRWMYRVLGRVREALPRGDL